MPLDDFIYAEDYIGTARDHEVPGGRDETDAIIRHERVQHADMEKRVTLTIDGVRKTVPRATAKTDHLGNRVYGTDGLPIPRYTTIHDAAAMPSLTDGKGAWDRTTLDDRIPVLCHRDHLDPVAVCRVCAVHVADKRSGRLMPACKNLVEDGMVVTTRRFVGEDGKPTRGAALADSSVRVLLQMLAVEHIRPDDHDSDRYQNELADLLGKGRGLPLPPPSQSRNRPMHPRSRPLEVIDPLPYSSRTLKIDHDRCILCDRCVRSCSDVRGFKVIGHTGKGYQTRIAFDLDRSMNDSSCTQCGECANACPTGAIVYSRRVTSTAWTGQGLPVVDNDGSRHSVVPADFDVPLPDGLLTAEQARRISLHGGYRPFAEVSLAYLKWNEGSIRRRDLRKGDELCRKGDYAATAFLLKDGEYSITGVQGVVGTDRYILGEMACLTGQRRVASITVASERGLVYEITRNLLDMTRRTRDGRRRLGEVYAERAMMAGLRDSEFHGRLGNESREELMKLVSSATLITAEPGGRILNEGDLAGETSGFYFVRLGFVEVTRSVAGRPWPGAILGAGKHFGEIALLRDAPEVRDALPREQRGRRTASVTALDEAELVRIDGGAFLDFLSRHPDARRMLVGQCLESIRRGETAPTPSHLHQQTEYARLGLYQGQSLLVLDLERCTRCDECTRGCADSHPDHQARLLREGLRFGNFLVTTCCRSCHKPYCLEGCPVDAIHRKGDRLEIQIDAHCIGCSLCERQCPYGAIQMVDKLAGRTGQRTASVEQKAVNCDLCGGLSVPYCVRACPHDAAFRFTGEQLLATVRRKP